MNQARSQPLLWWKGSAFGRVASTTGRTKLAMAVAARFASYAGQAEDLSSLQHEACRAAAEGLGADFAKLLVHDPTQRNFLVVAGVGWRSDVVGSRLDADPGTAAGFAWHNGEPVISNALDVERRFRNPSLVAEYRLRRGINVPVVGPGPGPSAFGVLVVGSTEIGQFTMDQADFLHLIAHGLAAASDRLVRQAICDAQSAHVAGEHALSLREIQHRIRNDLQRVCSSIGRECRLLEDAGRRAGYDRVARQVLAIAGLYDHLLNVGSGELVEMGAALDTLCHRIAAAADLPARGIEVRVEWQPIRVPADAAVRLAVAVNELVANAADHAFPDGRSGRITVRLFASVVDGASVPIVAVRDDGCGFKGTRPGGAGLGFVERLARGAGGVLTRNDEAGTEWRITLNA